MILPIIGAVTAAQVGIWVVGGAISAVSGWAVRQILKHRKLLAAQNKRIAALEQA